MAEAFAANTIAEAVYTQVDDEGYEYILKRQRIIAKIKTRYFRKDQKFGITLPKTVKEALQLDRDSGTTYWYDAITKEMTVILPALKILEDGVHAPIGYQKIPCHVICHLRGQNGLHAESQICCRRSCHRPADDSNLCQRSVKRKC